MSEAPQTPTGEQPGRDPDAPIAPSQRGLILLFSAAMLILAVAPLFMFGGEDRPKPQPNEHGSEVIPREVEAVSENGFAARVAWGHYEVLHLVDEPITNGRNGLARGQGIAEVWTEEADALTRFNAFQKEISNEERVWIEELFKKVLSDPSPTQRGGWIRDLVLETRGRGADGLGEMQRLLLATQLAKMLKVEALAIQNDTLGPIIVAELSSPKGPRVGDWLTPIVYRTKPAKGTKGPAIDKEDRLVFMLGAFGHSAPVLGMNLDGLAMLRLPIQFRKEQAFVQTGPDALTEMRVLLQARTQAGVDDGQIGRDLIDLNETRMITRLSTASGLLAADPDSAWRYEWGVSSDMNVSGGLEFARLGKDGPLAATSQFLSPELRDKNMKDEYLSPFIKEFRREKSIKDLIEWVQDASGRKGRVPARIVLIPKLKRVLYFEGGDVYDRILNPMLDLELGRALGVKW